MHKAYLHLEDCSCLEGLSFDPYFPPIQDEIVFIFESKDYAYTLTNPIMRDKVIAFLSPLSLYSPLSSLSDWESSIIQAKAIILPFFTTSPHTESSILDWLKQTGIPTIWNINTGHLYSKMKEELHTSIALSSSPQFYWDNITCENLPAYSTFSHKIIRSGFFKHLIVINCGLQQNLLEQLESLPCSIEFVAPDFDFSHMLFDGVVISNGPIYQDNFLVTTDIIKKIVKLNKPILGIEVGFHILALATDLILKKNIPFTWSPNHTLVDFASNSCFTIPRLHSFDIENINLSEWNITQKNPHNDCIEALEHKTKPYFGFQFCPQSEMPFKGSPSIFDYFFRLL